MCFQPQNRRGLSSVVGALFFTVLMVAGFSVLSLALDAQTDIVTTQRIISDIEIKKQQEHFGILASTDANDLLSVSINNQGQNPVEISSIWITNKTLSDQPATRYTINYDDAFIPSGFTTNVISTQTLEMTPDSYDIKVISAIGTIKTIELDMIGGGTSGLRAEMITDPPDVIIGQNVTIAMLVTNTGTLPITNVIPNVLGYATTGTLIAPITSPPIPTSANLDRGESVLFTWDYLVTGSSGDELTFSSSATGDGPIISNPVSDISILREPSDGGSGGTDPDIINDELLARPQLFFIIPSSQGKSSDDQAVWGVNIVNPVNADMKVSKLIITAFAPGANNNDKVFDGACNLNPIFPVTGLDPNWTCPNDNAIMWQSSSPVTIPANSTKTFMIKIEPGKPSGSSSLEAIIVQGSVFTDFGSFGKSGYQSTMSGTTSSIVNVYFTDDILNPRLDGNIHSTRIGILPDSIQTFDIILADMDDDDSTTVIAATKLIINVPKDWTEVIVTGYDGFVGTPSVTKFGDNSHQIVGITSGVLGTDTNPTDRITFTARAPNISVDELYVMYVLAQGTTSSGFSIGPLNEMVLQVNGD